jgi:hypothetical protein
VALDKALVLGSSALAGTVMRGSEGLYLDELCFTELRDLYLEKPEPEFPVTPAGEESAERDNGFGGLYANGLGPKGLGPEGLVFEGSAPPDDALERLDPADSTREVANLAPAAVLDGSAPEGPPVGGLASKTDAL